MAALKTIRPETSTGADAYTGKLQVCWELDHIRQERAGAEHIRFRAVKTRFVCTHGTMHVSPCTAAGQQLPCNPVLNTGYASQLQKKGHFVLQLPWYYRSFRSTQSVNVRLPWYYRSFRSTQSVNVQGTTYPVSLALRSSNRSMAAWAGADATSAAPANP
jgi:hypothetical protein